MNEKGLLDSSVPDGYTKLCLVGEFNLFKYSFPFVMASWTSSTMGI
jgi:hypothetical protein